jgi:MerR family transcriptional regulator, copper efflux regulator
MKKKGAIRRLTIGRVAEMVGVGVETIRYYEREGIIEQPPREEGFREYSEDVIHRVRFIKRAQELGFSLDEISELLSLHVKGRGTCSTVKEKADQKLKQIEEKISDLRKIQQALIKVKKICERQPPLEKCPVLEDFYA